MGPHLSGDGPCWDPELPGTSLVRQLHRLDAANRRTVWTDTMRKLLLLAILLFAARPASATWTMVQHKSNTACSGTSCNVTVTAIGSGHALIAVALMDTAARTISSASGGGGTWVHPASCASTVAGVGAADVIYNLSSSTASTTVTVNISGTASWVAEVIEYSFTGSSAALDVCNFRNDNSATINIAGATLSPIGGTNDVIVQAGFFTGSAS